MVVMPANEAAVDHCHRCGGVAIEASNLEGAVSEWANPQHWIDHFAMATTGARLVCPVDHAPMTGYQVAFDRRSVVVDHCDQCGTMWFDRGEARKLVEIVSGAHAFQPVLQRAHDELQDQQTARMQDSAGAPGPASYIFQLLTGMPIEVWNPVRGSTPAMKIMLIVLACLFGVQWFYAMTDPIRGYAIVEALGFVPETFFGGARPWTLVTYAFLHAHLFHFASNAYFLWIFGDNVEDRLGTVRFVGIYIATAIFGALLHGATHPTGTMPVIGASGAVAGLMAAYFVLFPRVKLWVVFIFFRFRVPVIVYFGLWLLAQFIMAWQDVAQVSWGAHIGGFVIGLVIAWLWKEAPPPLTAAERRTMVREQRYYR